LCGIFETKLEDREIKLLEAAKNRKLFWSKNIAA